MKESNLYLVLFQHKIQTIQRLKENQKNKIKYWKKILVTVLYKFEMEKDFFKCAKYKLKYSIGQELRAQVLEKITWVEILVQHPCYLYDFEKLT